MATNDEVRRFVPVHIAILTVSDSRTPETDRSGRLLADKAGEAGHEVVARAIVVDDAALEVGRVRFRPEGGPGGHNGLKSISGALRSDEYARLRIGVGIKPDGSDLSDWVLTAMPEEDEDVVVGLLPELPQAVETWMSEGTEAAMNRLNR